MKTSDNTGLTADDVTVLARMADVPVKTDVAERIAASIGPALKSFSPIAGTLPFDLEPASFVAVQRNSGT